MPARFQPLGYTAPETAEILRRARSFYERIRARRSVRDFSDRPVPRQVIELARFDVPYFFVNCNETKICSVSGKCEDGYYDEPPIHGLLPSWRRFTPAYRMAAMSEIKQAVLSTAAHDHGQHR